jgi:hypothetical protein
MSNPLAELSILLHLTISKWDGQVSDQRALQAVARAFKGDTSKDRYRKSLFVNDPLKGVDRCAGRIRNNFYKWTLPWQDGGGRLVPSLDFRDFQRQHAELVGDFDFEVNEFLLTYDEHRELARSHRGDLYRDDDYPSVHELQERFCVVLQTLPFPSSSDFRVEAPEEIITDLRASIDATVIQVTQSVASNMQARIQDRLKVLYEALDSEKRFTKALFEELSFVVQMARSLKDVIPQKLRDNVDLIEEHILAYTPDQVRNSESLRIAMAMKADDILERL